MLEVIKDKFRRHSIFVYSIICLVMMTFAVGVALAVDSDSDGMSDAYEDLFHLNASNALDATYDNDGDNLTNSTEYLISTDPHVVDTDRDTWNDDVDSNALSRLFIDWGASLYTYGDKYEYTGPNWWLSAFKVDGEWNSTNPTAWHVASSVTAGEGSLNIEINRNILTNDIILDLKLYDHPNASLYIDLYDIASQTIATNIYGNILSGTEKTVQQKYSIPLESYINVAGILLRRGFGAITVYESLLYIDQDGDGLDIDQEIVTLLAGDLWQAGNSYQQGLLHGRSKAAS